jgi:type I restriction enzyme S subunit
MSYKRLGDYIHLVDNRNSDLEYTNLLGINITKNFMPSVANVTNTDLSKYKIIKKGQFAYSGMQTGRDETIRIVLYTEDEPAIISPAYSVVEVNDEKELLPEFMMMWFQRPESDRYGWFISDSSVRANLDYERLCDIEIPIPDDIEEQRKYVNLYKGLLNNQECYEKSLDDLQLICDTYIEDLILKEKPKTLGDYIEQCEERNEDLSIDNLLGISVDKIFIQSKSNKETLNLAGYKVIRNRQFGYVSVTSRNGEKISIALLKGEPGLISSTYTAFRVKDATEILPEYLFLFFQRAEFDRYARFHSWGSARETFDWDAMCEVQIPVPDIKIQEAIVTIYHTLETRKRLNEQLKGKIQPLCPILMRGVVEDSLKPLEV